MFKKNIQFYLFSFLIIFILLLLFFNKMNSTYIAKNNFIVFKEILKNYENKNYKDLKFFIKDNDNIKLKNDSQNLKIYIFNVDYRACLKYGVEYIDSNFQSISINKQVLSRTNIVTRDVILDKCNQTVNNLIMFQKMEKK